VDPAVGGYPERRRRYQRAVRDDRHTVRFNLPQPVEERRLPRPGRGQHLHPVRVGPRPGRGPGEVPPAAGGRVRAGEHGDQLVPGDRDRVECGYRLLGRPGEDEAHQPSGPCGLTLTTGGRPVSYHSAPRIAFMASLRASRSSRSTNSTPSRWSVSCCTQRASSPEPTSWTGSPYAVKPLATTLRRRLVSKYSPG